MNNKVINVYNSMQEENIKYIILEKYLNYNICKNAYGGNKYSLIDSNNKTHNFDKVLMKSENIQDLKEYADKIELLHANIKFPINAFYWCVSDINRYGDYEDITFVKILDYSIEDALILVHSGNCTSSEYVKKFNDDSNVMYYELTTGNKEVLDGYKKLGKVHEIEKKYYLYHNLSNRITIEYFNKALKNSGKIKLCEAK